MLRKISKPMGFAMRPRDSGQTLVQSESPRAEIVRIGATEAGPRSDEGQTTGPGIELPELAMIAAAGVTKDVEDLRLGNCKRLGLRKRPGYSILRGAAPDATLPLDAIEQDSFNGSGVEAALDHVILGARSDQV